MERGNHSKVPIMSITKGRWIACVAWVKTKVVAALLSLVVDWIKFLLGMIVGGLVGSVTTLFVIDHFGTTVDQVQLPPGYDRYGFVSQHFYDVKAELPSSTSLIFKPPELQRIRFCGDANFQDRPQGEAYLDELLNRLGKCLVQSEETVEGRQAIVIRPNTAVDSGYVETYRSLGPNLGNESLFFCGCEDETVRLLEKNNIYP